MAKSLLYRLFGVGKLSKEVVDNLNREELLLMDEGIGGSMTYRDFHAPGKRFSWRKVAFTGSVAVTKQRLFALQYSNPAINVPFDDERFKQLRISVEGKSTLLVAFDAGLFHSDWSGTIEYRFKTPQAGEFLKLITNR